MSQAPADHSPPQAAQPSPPPHHQPAPAADALVFPLHAGARSAYLVVVVLLTILVIGIPFAVWALIARSRGRLEARGPELVTVGFFRKRLDLRQARRLGVLHVPILARGIGGALARRKVGGDHAVHLCMMDERGRKSNLLVSMYEHFPAAIDHALAWTGLPLEQVESGAFGPRWPEQR
jgi:hypothetical protein